MFFGEFPVDLKPKSRLFIHINIAVTDLRTVFIDALPNRIAIARTVGFHGVSAAWKGGNKMAMQFRRMVRRDHHAMVIGNMGNA